MFTIKKNDVKTVFLFADSTYIDKLYARNIKLNAATPSSSLLQIDLVHYAKRKRGNLEDSDFTCLQNGCNQIVKVTLRDETVAKKIEDSDTVAILEIDIGADAPIQCLVKKQDVDHHGVTFEI